jgi:site-specific DNA recombinase
VVRAVWEKVQERLRTQAAHHRTIDRGVVSSPLAGKLFDENCEPLYACGANKRTRRYRYYVSRKVIRGSSDKTRTGWRLPALEIERAVSRAGQKMLADQPAIAVTLQDAGVPIGDLQSALDAAARKSKQLVHDAEIADNLRNLIDRVQLESGGIRVSLNLKRLLAEPIDTGDPAGLTMTRFIPIEMKRRGVEIRLVIEGEAARAARPDPALLKAIARGHRWLKRSQHMTVADRRSGARPFPSRASPPRGHRRSAVPTNKRRSFGGKTSRDAATQVARLVALRPS